MGLGGGFNGGVDAQEEKIFFYSAYFPLLSANADVYWERISLY